MKISSNYQKYFRLIAKQLNYIYKRFTPPKRFLGDLLYSKEAANIANCLEHAVFNFTDEMLVLLVENFGEDVVKFWSGFNSLCYKFEREPKRQLKDLTNEIIKRINKSGLKIEECDLNDCVKDGQFKVAYYFDFCENDSIRPCPDFHFMRQEIDGTWSSKFGRCEKVETFDTLPEIYNESYRLQKIFKITNPYFHKLLSEDEKENQD